MQFESDPGFFSRFQREEEIGLKLNHPNILKFIPVEKKSRPYIVTEYLRGYTLGHLLNNIRPMAMRWRTCTARASFIETSNPRTS
jgi:serine/threonine protein kinase